ncbi:MAG: hypothetical protein PHW69_02220 [Elusimicrobiaceae bacterium]|nr:hypothetical protein [Elusimicrobiaceae bacterium]
MIKLLGAVLCSAVVLAGTAGFKTYKNGYFSTSVPGWTLSAVTEDEEFGVYSTELVSPDSTRLAPAMIYVSYYAPGNALYADIPGFIKGMGGGAVTVKGNSVKPAVRSKAGKYSAKAFESTQVKFIPPDSPDAKEVRIREKHVLVADSKKKGFYVLRLFAGGSVYEKNLKVFNEVVAGFVRLK